MATREVEIPAKYMISAKHGFVDTLCLEELNSFGLKDVEEIYQEVVRFFLLELITKHYNHLKMQVPLKTVHLFIEKINEEGIVTKAEHKNDKRFKNGVVVDYLCKLTNAKEVEFKEGRKWLSMSTEEEGTKTREITFEHNDNVLKLKSIVDEAKARKKRGKLFSPILREEIKSKVDGVYFRHVEESKFNEQFKLAFKKMQLAEQVEAAKIHKELGTIVKSLHSSKPPIGKLKKTADNLNELLKDFSEEHEENYSGCKCKKCSIEQIKSAFRTLEYPIYSAKKGASRIYLETKFTDVVIREGKYFQDVKQSAQNLRSSLRKIVFPKDQGFIELDLKSAHLSFLSAITDNAYLQSLMKTNLTDKSFWNELSEELKVNRDGLKRVINSKIYGAKYEMQLISYFAAKTDDELTREFKSLYSKYNNLKKQEKYFDSEFASTKASLLTLIDEDSKSEFEVIKASKFYKEVTGAIEKLKTLGKERGYLIDAWGQKLDYVNFEEDEQTYDTSVMHKVFYSYEKYLLYPVYVYYDAGNPAYELTSYRLVYDAHDGLTICIDNENKREITFNALKTMVENRAKKLGVFNTLSAK